MVLVDDEVMASSEGQDDDDDDDGQEEGNCSNLVVVDGVEYTSSVEHDLVFRCCCSVWMASDNDADRLDSMSHDCHSVEVCAKTGFRIC